MNNYQNYSYNISFYLPLSTSILYTKTLSPVYNHLVSIEKLD